MAPKSKRRRLGNELCVTLLNGVDPRVVPDNRFLGRNPEPS